MRTILFAICILPFLVACRKNGCISCIAESRSGQVVKHTMDCDKDTDYLSGFQDGLTDYYKEHGDTVTVKCIYGK